MLKYLWLIVLLILPVSAFGEEDVLRLLIWEGHAPKQHVLEFEKQIEKTYKRKVKLNNEPLSWNIFWDPAFKGKYVIGANEYIYNVNITATLIITNIGDRLTDKEKEHAHIWTPNFFDKNRILVSTYSKKDRNGLKLLWDEAMDGILSKKEDGQ